MRWYIQITLGKKIWPSGFHTETTWPPNIKPASLFRLSGKIAWTKAADKLLWTCTVNLRNQPSLRHGAEEYQANSDQKAVGTNWEWASAFTGRSETKAWLRGGWRPTRGGVPLTPRECGGRNRESFWRAVISPMGFTDTNWESSVSTVNTSNQRWRRRKGRGENQRSRARLTAGKHSELLVARRSRRVRTSQGALTQTQGTARYTPGLGGTHRTAQASIVDQNAITLCMMGAADFTTAHTRESQ